MLLKTISWTLVALTVLPLWRNPVWWVRVFDFPRLQLATLLASTLLSGLIGKNQSALTAGAVAASLTYQLWWILPYSKLHRKEVATSTRSNPASTIRLLIFNVLASNRKAQEFLDLVNQNDPDLVVTLESDKWWEQHLDSLSPRYPFAIKCPLDNLYGIHLYSKLRLENSAIQFLVEPHVPSIHTEVILRSGVSVRLHSLHPSPPVPHYTGQSEERDAELLVVGKSIAESDSPIIVTGDLNDVAWSETTRLFRKISGLLDPRVGRQMLNTFHTGLPFLRWPLDHVFHSSHFKLSVLKRLPSTGSDHFPVLVELVYEPQGQASEGLSATVEDHQLAEEKLEAQNVTPEQVHEPDRDK